VAVFLLVLGITCLTIGLVRLLKQEEGGFPLLLVGAIVFIPYVFSLGFFLAFPHFSPHFSPPLPPFPLSPLCSGSYQTYVLYKACRGAQGYSFRDVPSFDD
jgi:hypothetical protein